MRPPRPIQAGELRKSMHPGTTHRKAAAMEQSRMYTVLDLEGHTESHSPRISKRQSTDDSEIELLTLNRDLSLYEDDIDESDKDIKAIMKKSFSLEDLALDEEQEDSTDESSECVDLDSPVPVLDYHYHAFENDDDLDSNANRGTLKKSESAVVLSSSQRATLTNNEPFRPTPAPRTSTLKRDDHQSQSSPLIELPASQLQKPSSPIQGSADLTSINNNSSSNNLDSSAVLSVDSKVSRSIPSLNTTSSSDSLENVKFDSSQSSLQSDTNSNPVPVPRLRQNVSRTNAFYNNQRPPSLARVSPVPQALDAQNIPKARTEFMQTKSIPKMSASNTSLDLFDPLLSGQLAIDKPCQSDPEKKSLRNEDENLLIDWTGIDFAKRKSANPPPVPPKPHIESPVKNPVGYMNLMHQSGASMSPSYQHYHHHSPSGLPRMGVAAVPGHPPMMRPYMGTPQPFMSSSYTGRPVSMYATSTPGSSGGNVSFLHNLRQTYTGPRANLNLPRTPGIQSGLSVSSPGSSAMNTSGQSAGNNTSQDPFGDLLNVAAQSDSTPKQDFGLNNRSSTLPKVQQTPVNQSGMGSNLNFQSSQSLAPKQLNFQTAPSPVLRQSNAQVVQPTVQNNTAAKQWEKFE